MTVIPQHDTDRIDPDHREPSPSTGYESTAEILDAPDAHTADIACLSGDRDGEKHFHPDGESYLTRRDARLRESKRVEKTEELNTLGFSRLRLKDCDDTERQVSSGPTPGDMDAQDPTKGMTERGLHRTIQLYRSLKGVVA